MKLSHLPRLPLLLLAVAAPPALAQQTTQYFVPAKQMVHGAFNSISGDATGNWTGFTAFNPDNTWIQNNVMPTGTALMITELSLNVPASASGTRLTFYVQVMNAAFTSIYEQESRTLDIPAVSAPFYSYVNIPLASHLTVAPGQHMRAGLYASTTGLGVAAGVNFKGYYLSY